MLEAKFIEKHFPDRVAKFTALPALIRIWFSLMDGECQVERDLGTMRDYIEEAKGEIGDDMLDSYLMTFICGPRTAEEVTQKAASGACEPTETTLRWNTLWRCQRGARFQLKRPKPRRAVKPSDAVLAKRSHSFKAAKRAVLQAAAKVRRDALHGQPRRERVRSDKLRRSC